MKKFSSKFFKMLVICPFFMPAESLAAEIRKPISIELMNNIVPACWGNISYAAFVDVPGMSFGPYPQGQQICMLTDGTVETTTWGADEGLGDAGKYKVLGDKIQFEIEGGAEGWMAFFSKPTVICDAAFNDSWNLILEKCSDGETHNAFKPEPKVGFAGWERAIDFASPQGGGE